MKTYFKALLTAIIFVPGLALANTQTLFNELQREGILKVELELSLATLESHARTDAEQAAVFRFIDKQGQAQEWSTDVNVRGRFRRRVCEFPPIKIDFSKRDLKARGLLPFDDLKLVTHCQEGKEGQEAVLREYMAYQLYGKLTPLNFRAQLVEITYIDTESNIRFTKYGILLEDTDELAARLNSEECEECYGLSASNINTDVYLTHAMFQYMIGNTDWSLAMGRNLKIMKPVDGGDYWISPYDFDFSGLVNVNYAIPNQDVGQEFVGQRVYMGEKFARSDLDKTIRLFQSKKEELISYVETFPLLDKSSRKEMARYLERFYDSLGQEDFFSNASLSNGNSKAMAGGR
ncbi:MAG: hypothetical protein KDD01_03895 [Phaeodactylibacter sp.]|nr:hypothetical protein [Phaeodactylibacter sp.]